MPDSVPEAGDIIWVDFNPVLGTEQAGRRPAIVVSESIYHEISLRTLVCPITTRARPWPFNVPLPDGLPVEGVILVDQVRMVHRPSRIFGTICKAPKPVLDHVRLVLTNLAGIALPP